MTLPRTKHRRDARKRAKARKGRPGNRLICMPWLDDEIARAVQGSLDICAQVLRQDYGTMKVGEPMTVRLKHPDAHRFDDPSS